VNNGPLNHTDPSGLRPVDMVSDAGTKTDSQCYKKRLDGIERDIEVAQDSHDLDAKAEVEKLYAAKSEVAGQYIDALNREDIKSVEITTTSSSDVVGKKVDPFKQFAGAEMMALGAVITGAGVATLNPAIAVGGGLTVMVGSDYARNGNIDKSLDTIDTVMDWAVEWIK